MIHSYPFLTVNCRLRESPDSFNLYIKVRKEIVDSKENHTRCIKILPIFLLFQGFSLKSIEKDRLYLLLHWCESQPTLFSDNDNKLKLFVWKSIFQIVVRPARQFASHKKRIKEIYVSHKTQCGMLELLFKYRYRRSLITKITHR